MNQKIIVESLSMDLKRIALGSHRGSFNMANKFKIEALERIHELEHQETDNYTKKLIEGVKKALNKTENRIADDTLMYSTLFQNLAQKKFTS